VKKILPAIVVAAIVLAFAGALFWRINAGKKVVVATDTTVKSQGPSVANDRPVVMWSVAASGNEDAKGYAYSLSSKKTTGPVEGFEGPGIVRFNQASNLCNPAYVVSSLALDCEANDLGILKLTVFDGDGGPQLLKKTIDPVALGIFPSGAEGYLVPVAAAEDKSAIYLGRRVETESFVAGLWRLDVPSGVITEITDVRKRNLYQYEINTQQKTLVGVTFTPPENLGADPTGPSSAYLVDLDTNKARLLAGAVVASTNAVVENPMVSEDGMEYAVHLYGSPVSTITSIKGPPVATVNGVVKDWFGDTLVVDRDGNLFLYDLATKTETQLTHETDATVEYLGVVR